jgi:hypothetical protein
MSFNSLLVSLDLNEFGHFYHGEAGELPSEWGPVAMDSDLVH